MKSLRSVGNSRNINNITISKYFSAKDIKFGVDARQRILKGV